MRLRNRAKEFSGLFAALSVLVLASFVYAEIVGASLWVRIFHGIWLGFCAVVLGYFLHAWKAAEADESSARDGMS
ncbi:MAG: hypothetical protein HY291_17740 [Planctomycetes bacterium]|nr:hypothetical protein [Planctomycetota bacterium]